MYRTKASTGCYRAFFRSKSPKAAGFILCCANIYIFSTVLTRSDFQSKTLPSDTGICNPIYRQCFYCLQLPELPDLCIVRLRRLKEKTVEEVIKAFSLNEYLRKYEYVWPSALRSNIY